MCATFRLFSLNVRAILLPVSLIDIVGKQRNATVKGELCNLGLLFAVGVAV